MAVSNRDANSHLFVLDMEVDRAYLRITLQFIDLNLNRSHYNLSNTTIPIDALSIKNNTKHQNNNTEKKERKGKDRSSTCMLITNFPNQRAISGRPCHPNLSQYISIQISYSTPTFQASPPHPNQQGD